MPTLSRPTRGVLLVLCLGLAAPLHAQESIRCAFPFWFGFAPVFVAQKLGYFEAEGIQVTTVFDNDRANVLPAIDSGDLDCTMRTLGEYMARPRQSDTAGTVIGTIDVSVGADGVVAAGDIQSVEDLLGKIFAGEINHPGTVMTQHALAQLGHSMDEVNVRLINTDDSAAVFEDSEVAAVATWEPMLGTIVRNSRREGAHVLLSSADFNGLITDVIIVRDEDLAARPEAYAGFLRGIYRAIDLYLSDPDRFIALSAGEYSVDDAEMKEALEGGVQYTSYEDTLDFMGTDETPGKLQQVFEDLNSINLSLALQDNPLNYADHVDASVVNGLFEGHER